MHPRRLDHRLGYANPQLLRGRVERSSVRVRLVSKVLARPERQRIPETSSRLSRIWELLQPRRPEGLKWLVLVMMVLRWARNAGELTNNVTNTVSQKDEGCACGSLCVSTYI